MRPEEKAPVDEAPHAGRSLQSVPQQAAEPSEERRRGKVPTSVLVTLLVALFSVFVGPAIARQWDDQQKSRELKAAIADEIAISTARTLAAGVYVARAQDRHDRLERLANARNYWRPASLRIETKLRAYFPARMAGRWERFASDVDDYLVNVCAKASPPGEGAGDLTDADRRANIAGWFEAVARAQPLPQSLSLRPFQRDRGRRDASQPGGACRCRRGGRRLDAREDGDAHSGSVRCPPGRIQHNGERPPPRPPPRLTRWPLPGRPGSATVPPNRRTARAYLPPRNDF